MIEMYFVHVSSQDRYIELVENEIFDKKEMKLLDFLQLCEDEKIDDLSKVFKL